MLIFGDPCGLIYSTTTQAAQGMWQSLAGGTIHTSGLPAGNVGSTAITVSVNGGVITVPTAVGPYIIGLRICLASVFSEQQIVAFRDASNGIQTSVYIESNGTLKFYRGNGSVLIGTTSNAVVLQSSVWAYVELQCSIGASGIIGAHINGVSVLQTTANTQGTGNTTIGNITIGSNLTMWVQDLIVTDSTGSYNNTYLGDVALTGYNSAGTGTAGLNQYTANGAATVWQATAAVTPTDSTVFASDSTPGDRMSNTLAQTAVTGTIAGIIHVSRVKKDAAGTRTFAQTITSNGADAIGATQAPGTSYAYFLQVSETDPNTAQPWKQAGFNAMQAGLETVA